MKLNPFSKKDNKKKPQTPAVAEDIQPEATPAKEELFSASNGGRTVLKNIYTSEKATRLIGNNQYVFRVSSDATKNEIKKEVALRYNVKVKNVRVINIMGKKRMLGKYPGVRPGYRKAIVGLEEGSVIAQAKP